MRSVLLSVTGFHLVRYVLAFGIGCVLVLLLTPPMRWAARRIDMVDQPDARRINTRPIPRGGGVAVFIGFHVSLALTSWLTRVPLTGSLGGGWHKTFFLASLILLVVGLVDDALGLRPWLKLAGQLVVATILYWGGARIGGLLWFATPEIVNYLLTMVWFIAIINAFNLIDGMDGLASGLALIGSLGLAVCLIGRHQTVAALPLIALAGACLGFLRYNFNPASIFLGDSGSMFLGLVLATVSLHTGGKTAFLASIGVPLLVMGVPLFDTVLAIWRRSVRAAVPSLAGKGAQIAARARVMQPDKEHLHHRVLASGQSQRSAAWFLYGISAVMVLTAVLASFSQNRAGGILLLGFLTVAFVASRHLSNVELWDTGRAIMQVVREPKLRRLTVPIYLAMDVCSLVFCWLVSNRLAHVPHTRLFLLLPVPIFVVPVIISMVLTRTYQRSWHNVRIIDYIILGITLAGGWLVGCMILILFGLRFPGWDRQALVMLLCMPFPIVGLRMTRKMISEWLSIYDIGRLGESQHMEQVLAYGGGQTFGCALRTYGMSKTWQQRRLIGIIDDDVVMKGRIISGYPVLGSGVEIAHVIGQYGIDGIIITAQLDPVRREALIRTARENHVWIREWRWSEETIVAAGQEK